MVTTWQFLYETGNFQHQSRNPRTFRQLMALESGTAENCGTLLSVGNENEEKQEPNHHHLSDVIRNASDIRHRVGAG